MSIEKSPPPKAKTHRPVVVKGSIPEVIPPSETRKHAPKSLLAAKVRRQRLVEALINGECLKDVAIQSGLSPKTASQQASDILKHPEAQATFLRILEEEGLTDEKLAAKLVSLLNAEHTVLAQHEGKFTDRKEIPAIETQRKTAELVARLKGHLKESSTGGNIEIGLMQMVVQVVRDGDDY
jgi:hypothetical protein